MFSSIEEKKRGKERQVKLLQKLYYSQYLIPQEHQLKTRYWHMPVVHQSLTIPRLTQHFNFKSPVALGRSRVRQVSVSKVPCGRGFITNNIQNHVFLQGQLSQPEKRQDSLVLHSPANLLPQAFPTYGQNPGQVRD